MAHEDALAPSCCSLPLLCPPFNLFPLVSLHSLATLTYLSIMSSFRVSVVAAAILLCGGLIGVVQLLQGNDQHQLIGEGLVPSSSNSVAVDESHRRLQFSQAEQELAKVRPIIYTYYEQPAQYDPNDDTLDLIENWRKAWFDMGK
jgi:hypothetical protein